MLNTRIKELRTARNLSQVEMAKRLGVTKQSVSNWENNNIQPSVDMLVMIARLFSVSTDYLLCLDNRQVLDVTGLSVEHVAHIQQVVDDIRGRNEPQS
ncbi:MAG TPA: helix-turn-helix domain-containing protein [Candidatus Ruthenibacterium merdavium]|uniref:Helix-turn-helix domain-containing protein n=1 Tax=Candidatus Ruthenibacterium merdavium TaxID=2838752 RepID=A0A9D2Q4L9_9FIRM|nr:helix-turn-helix domain-containing protein [Candidatus Ruthenibacterium merdavium]